MGDSSSVCLRFIPIAAVLDHVIVSEWICDGVLGVGVLESQDCGVLSSDG